MQRNHKSNTFWRMLSIIKRIIGYVDITRKTKSRVSKEDTLSYNNNS